MNSAYFKRIMVQGVAVCAVCAGGWMLTVRPERTELRRARADLERQNAVIASAAGETGDAQLASRAAALREQAEAVDRSLEVSGHESRLYAALNEAAVRYGVRVERMEPRRESRSRSKGDEGPKVTALAFEVTATGSYDSIRAFVGEIERGTGPGRLSACRVSTSAMSSDELAATIQTIHFGLETPLAAVMTEPKGEEP